MGSSASLRKSSKTDTTAVATMLPTLCSHQSAVSTDATRNCLEADKDWTKQEKPDDSESRGPVAPLPPLDSTVGGVQRQLSDCDLPDTDWNRLTTSYWGEEQNTLIFLDWDDTLFPTTDLSNRMDLEHCVLSKDPLPADVVELLADWRAAVYAYLVTATKLSSRCVILTNARRPWIDDCCKVFAPELMPMIDEKTGTVGVVYANEVPLLPRMKNSKERPNPATRIDEDDFATKEKLKKQKQAAMHREAKGFYSQYPGQTWKNIFSIGDMDCEHDALQEVTFTRKAPKELRQREEIRTKAVLVPSEPALAELTLRLRFEALVLPACINLDGDIDLDLQTAQEPYKMVMKALGLPSLAELDFPSFAWGRPGPTPSSAEIEDALRSLEDGLPMFECLS